MEPIGRHSTIAAVPHWNRWIKAGASTLIFKATQPLTGHKCFGDYLPRMKTENVLKCKSGGKTSTLYSTCWKSARDSKINPALLRTFPGQISPLQRHLTSYFAPNRIECCKQLLRGCSWTQSGRGIEEWCRKSSKTDQTTTESNERLSTLATDASWE